MLNHPDNLNSTDGIDNNASLPVDASTRKKRTKATSSKSADAATAKPAREKKSESKADAVLKRLRSARGVTVQQLVEATGWQAHSVRGFLSGVVRKKLGLTLHSESGKDGVRRYRIDDTASTSEGAGNADAGTGAAGSGPDAGVGETSA